METLHTAALLQPPAMNRGCSSLTYVTEKLNTQIAVRQRMSEKVQTTAEPVMKNVSLRYAAFIGVTGLTIE